MGPLAERPEGAKLIRNANTSLHEGLVRDNLARNRRRRHQRWVTTNAWRLSPRVLPEKKDA